MTVKLIGSFVFINQEYGILSSVYHNNIATEPYPETAKRKKDSEETTDLFEGMYSTIWLEVRDVDDRTDLEITRQRNGTYKLTWFDSKKTYYNGIGFLHDNKLVGSYWQVPA